MSLPHRRFGILVAGALLCLAGCTASPSTPDPTAPTLPDPVTLSGSGPQSTTLTVPEGAESLHVRLACTSGGFYISSVNTDLVDARAGYCGGMTTVIVPIATGPTMEVTVTVDEVEYLVAELQFSSRPVHVDAAVAEDCEALGVFSSLYQDAEVGFDEGLIDRAAWRSAIDDAAAALEGMTPTPMIEPQSDALLEWISAVEEPGFWLTDPSWAARAADILAGQVCTDNGTTITVLRQYGG